eukprot:jgi/Mesvir1/26167/Mv06865-RA.1
MVAWPGSRATRTSGGLTSDDLVRRKDGRVVSKAKSEIGAQNPWAKFVKKVHAETGGSLSDAMVEAKRQLDGLMRERGLANTAENRREVLGLAYVLYRNFRDKAYAYDTLPWKIWKGFWTSGGASLSYSMLMTGGSAHFSSRPVAEVVEATVSEATAPTTAA